MGANFWNLLWGSAARHATRRAARHLTMTPARRTLWTTQRKQRDFVTYSENKDFSFVRWLLSFSVSFFYKFVAFSCSLVRISSSLPSSHLLSTRIFLRSFSPPFLPQTLLFHVSSHLHRTCFQPALPQLSYLSPIFFSERYFDEYFYLARIFSHIPRRPLASSLATCFSLSILLLFTSLPKCKRRSTACGVRDKQEGGGRDVARHDVDNFSDVSFLLVTNERREASQTGAGDPARQTPLPRR